METIKITKSQAWPIVKHVFPEYNGRKFKLSYTDKLTIYNTNWDGGTRNQYAAIRADGQSGVFNAPAPWNNGVEGQTIDMRPDTLVIVHSHFCGHDMGITIYAHPSLAPKVLTGSMDRTWIERQAYIQGQ